MQFYTICAVALERARKCQNAVIAASKIKIFSGVWKYRIAGHRNTIICALKGLWLQFKTFTLFKWILNIEIRIQVKFCDTLSLLIKYLSFMCDYIVLFFKSLFLQIDDRSQCNPVKICNINFRLYFGYLPFCRQ